VVIVVDHIASVSGIIHNDIGGIAGVSVCTGDFELGHEIALGTEYLDAMIAGVCNVNSAGRIDVDAKWLPEFTAVGSFPSKRRKVGTVVVEDFDFAVDAVYDVDAIFFRYRDIAGGIEPVSDVEQVFDLGEQDALGRRCEPQRNGAYRSASFYERPVKFDRIRFQDESPVSLCLYAYAAGWYHARFNYQKVAENKKFYIWSPTL
jgi:hypothetical protein